MISNKHLCPADRSSVPGEGRPALGVGSALHLFPTRVSSAPSATPLRPDRLFAVLEPVYAINNEKG